MLLCEDSLHEVFVRRFLKRRGLDTRQLRVRKSPGGSAEQFVRKEYPIELRALRRRHAKTVLIVVIDGDSDGVQMRRASLADACRAADVENRTAAEHVVVIVPTWNIETWLAYLAGESVDETRGDYQRLHEEADASPRSRRWLPCASRDSCARPRRLRFMMRAGNTRDSAAPCDRNHSELLAWSA